MCWQILAAKSLQGESMKVYAALKTATLPDAQKAVSMIVGRDTERLDEPGVARAAVETVAENTSDGVIAPLFYLALGGAGLGFFYKAVNTMDSMLGYVEPPYKNIGLIPAKLDDVFNFIPARLSALFLLAAGVLLHLDVKNGWQMFQRDRYKHASPNSAQTESVCAGLLGLRLAGDAWYHGCCTKGFHRRRKAGNFPRGYSARVPSDVCGGSAGAVRLRTGQSHSDFLRNRLCYMKRKTRTAAMSTAWRSGSIFRRTSTPSVRRRP